MVLRAPGFFGIGGLIERSTHYDWVCNKRVGLMPRDNWIVLFKRTDSNAYTSLISNFSIICGYFRSATLAVV